MANRNSALCVASLTCRNWQTYRKKFLYPEVEIFFQYDMTLTGTGMTNVLLKISVLVS